MSGDDERDVRKARAILLAFSTLVLLLWFFGADLHSFKLMANEVRITKNLNHIWLVIALANTYFWFRYVQHLPKGWSTPDADMKELYEAALMKLSMWYYHSKFLSRIEKQLNSKTEPRRVTKINAKPTMTYRIEQREHGERRSYTSFHEITVDLGYVSRVKGKDGDITSSGTKVTIEPSVPLVVVSKVYSFTKGVFIEPWFTDRVLPFLYGFSSVCLALTVWLQINYNAQSA